MRFVFCRGFVRCRHAVLVCLSVFACFFTISTSSAQTFLPPDEAFGFKATMIAPHTAQVSFSIAPHYYMYREAFTVEVVSPDGGVVQNGGIKMPTSVAKFDPNFNKIVEVYHDKVRFVVPLKGAGLYKLVVTSRGCAEDGLCYPPRKTQAVLTAIDAPSAQTNAVLSPSMGVGQDDKKTTPTYMPLTPRNDTSTATSDAVLNAPATVSVALVQPVNAVTQQATNPLQPIAVNAAAPESKSTNSTNNNTVNIDNTAYARNLLAEHGFVAALALVFGLGVLLSLTPCMLPMLPILSAVLAGQKAVSRRRGFALALSYVTGMAVVYAVVGVIAAQTGAGVHRYLQSPWLLAAFAAGLVVLALSMFDVFQLQLPARWQSWLNQRTQGQYGYSGVALMGAISALVASPCVTAPLVGLIAYIAQTGDVWVGGLALFVLSYGMGLPLLLLGAGLGQFLPKSGAWMVRVKQAIGALMLLAALWVAQPLWGSYWASAWGHKTATQTFKPIKNLSDLRRVIETSDKSIVLDLYADWCRSCIEMEQKTFSDEQVKKQFEQMTLVRVDMTRFGDDDAALLAHFKLYGPPALIVLEPVTGGEKLRVVGFEAAELFAAHLKTALSKDVVAH